MLIISLPVPPLDNEFHVVESSIVTQIAENWHSVIVGRGGYHLLRENPRHLAVFIYANTDFRSKRIQEIYNMSAEAAVKLIEASDQDRQRYLRNVIGSDWADAQLYHLSIDTSALGFALAEEMVLDSMLARLEGIFE
ncbi:MAG: cytidylate kinase-like family protein [Armatimonadota bacterium]